MYIRLGFATVLAVTALLLPRAAGAAGFTSPDECKAYEGDAHLNCLYAYIEIQKDKLQKIEQEQHAQRERLDQLDNRMRSQSAVTEGGVSAPPPVSYAPAPVYPGYAYPPLYSYWYPTPGLSIYLGRGGFYGRPYLYGGGYGGPRFYGPRFGGGRFGHRRW